MAINVGDADINGGNGDKLGLKVVVAEASHYVIEGTEIKEGKTYSNNMHWHVIAKSLDDAFTICRQAHPTATFHVIRKVGSLANYGWNGRLYFDPAIFA